MTHEASWTTVLVFAVFVALTLGISFYFAARARSAKGYFAAHGEIHWFVNGVAFAGDYLSAASFLGICGMIAFYGYDGFLYSIGYLAGWVVALFVISEPLKRLGKYTFADALDSRFQSRGLKLAAAVSTLAVSIFYLIPQMVGAGVLIRPLLGFPHWLGVVSVGAVVITIVVTAGMVSTTYVQFLKGTLLVVLSTVLTVLILERGLETTPKDRAGYAEKRNDRSGLILQMQEQGWAVLPSARSWADRPYLQFQHNQTGEIRTWRRVKDQDDRDIWVATVTATMSPDGTERINGLPPGQRLEYHIDLPWHDGETRHMVEHRVADLPSGGHLISLSARYHWSDLVPAETGPVGPLEFLAALREGTVLLWRSEVVKEADGSRTTVYYPVPTSGEDVLRPGTSPLFPGLSSGKLTDRLNFLSLMLALFCGTASLPHILIRYYTVKDEASARKSTVVGIGSIGFFYILTLFMGLGAMTSGVVDMTDSNMAAPLLARSFGELMFAAISAVAFTTVLGTVSGLIVAASGAVAHDVLAGFFRIDMSDYNKVRAGKLTAVAVGLIAVVLGILFQKMNVNYLVGWAFSVAASANLPALVMLLFWRGTTKQGLIAAVVVGMVSSLAWILLSGDTYRDVYGLPAESAIVPFSQPGIVTIPLGFVTLIAVSLLTRRRASPAS